MARSTQSIPGNRGRIAFTQVVPRILKLAERQWGVVAHWQLKECGLSTSAITRWTASGRLHRIYPGVYAVGHKALSTEGRLIVPIGPDNVDALWREARVIVEVDGGDGHGTIAQMRRDRERDLRLRDAGFVVLRCSGLQVTSSRPAVAADIRSALQSRAYA
jgi:putative AbiEi antitoxin of type IV toxin-antitoxin system/uncharacterized protein DUF559